MIYVDLEAEIPNSCKIDNVKHRVACEDGWAEAIKDHQRNSLCANGEKAERKLSTVNSNFSIVGAYSGIMCMALSAGRLLVAESRWSQITSRFPGVAVSKMYGN